MDTSIAQEMQQEEPQQKSESFFRTFLPIGLIAGALYGIINTLFLHYFSFNSPDFRLLESFSWFYADLQRDTHVNEINFSYEIQPIGMVLVFFFYLLSGFISSLILARMIHSGLQRKIMIGILFLFCVFSFFFFNFFIEIFGLIILYVFFKHSNKEIWKIWTWKSQLLFSVILTVVVFYIFTIIFLNIEDIVPYMPPSFRCSSVISDESKTVYDMSSTGKMRCASDLAEQNDDVSWCDRIDDDLFRDYCIAGVITKRSL